MVDTCEPWRKFYFTCFLLTVRGNVCLLTNHSQMHFIPIFMSGPSIPYLHLTWCEDIRTVCSIPTAFSGYIAESWNLDDLCPREIYDTQNYNPSLLKHSKTHLMNDDCFIFYVTRIVISNTSIIIYRGFVANSIFPLSIHSRIENWNNSINDSPPAALECVYRCRRSIGRCEWRSGWNWPKNYGI